MKKKITFMYGAFHIHYLRHVMSRQIVVTMMPLLLSSPPKP